MNKYLFLLLIMVPLIMVGACARDLSSATYTSDTTLSLTLEGKILSVRPVTIKGSDKLTGNSTGLLAGAAAGGAAGSSVGGGSGKAAAVVGGAIIGATIGALSESQLSKANGFEYIVKVDTKKLKGDYYEGSQTMRNAISSATTSGLVTIVQGKDVVLSQGQKVFVIFSEKRTRIIPAS